VASDLIERTAHGGSETRSRIDPSGGVSEVGAQEWHASEHAGPEGRNPKKPLSHLFRTGRNGRLESVRRAQQCRRNRKWAQIGNAGKVPNGT
jgi:hypothetical protein